MGYFQYSPIQADYEGLHFVRVMRPNGQVVGELRRAVNERDWSVDKTLSGLYPRVTGFSRASLPALIQDVERAVC